MLGVDDKIRARSTYPLLSVEGVKISYRANGASNVAVGDVSFEVHRGEKVMLLGPSGCGKSTLLKAIAGFIEPDGGSISFAGKKDLRPGPDRAVVFQEFDQLFPWRTVMDNVAYPLRVTGKSKEEAGESAERYVEMMGLSPAADRYPHQLSGGMKQRVAIARALALEPLVLLMDEPFGSLDAQTRNRLQKELNEIARTTGVTVLFVTHSIQEAMVVGDRVVMLGHAPSEVIEVLDVSGSSDPDSESIVWLNEELHAVKWRHFKINFKRQQHFHDPELPLGFARIVNLIDDPKEREPVNQTYVRWWVMQHAHRTIAEFEESVRREQLIPAGSPLDFVPETADL